LASGVAIPIHAAGVRIGTLLAFSRAPGLAEDVEAALVRLATASIGPLVNARRFRATLDLVRTDSLTGLRNRRAYDEELVQEIERSRRAGTPLTLLMVDLDDFGLINKQHGLGIGDDVLIAFADVLRRTARTVDTVCRRGGEEFVIVLPDTGCHEAQQFFSRLRHEVGLTAFPGTDRLTFSAAG